MLQRCFMGVLKYFKGVFRWFMGVSRAFDAHYNVVPWLIQWCFKFVCRVSLESYEEALLNSGGSFERGLPWGIKFPMF